MHKQFQFLSRAHLAATRVVVIHMTMEGSFGHLANRGLEVARLPTREFPGCDVCAAACRRVSWLSLIARHPRSFMMRFQPRKPVELRL
jgi:hypothetical protein